MVDRQGSDAISTSSCGVRDVRQELAASFLIGVGKGARTGGDTETVGATVGRPREFTLGDLPGRMLNSSNEMATATPAYVLYSWAGREVIAV
jgi:hypothetical protein